jgi:hypothetical protein
MPEKSPGGLFSGQQNPLCCNSAVYQGCRCPLPLPTAAAHCLPPTARTPARGPSAPPDIRARHSASEIFRPSARLPSESYTVASTE